MEYKIGINSWAGTVFLSFGFYWHFNMLMILGVVFLYFAVNHYISETE